MYEIPQDLLQTVVNYLLEQPYKNVAGLIQQLSQLKQAEVVPPKPVEDPKKK